MGNKSSGKTNSEGVEEVLNRAMTDPSSSNPEAAGAKPDETPQLVIQGVNTQQPKTPVRRIVKATPPKSSADNLSAVQKAQDEDDDDDGFEKVNYSSVASSSFVGREIEQEKKEMIKKDLMQSAVERQRQKREQQLKNRRLQPQPTKESSAKKEEIKANPMSRFLSVFSVESQHPEHKRPYEKGTGSNNSTTDSSYQGDDTEVMPETKKRKASIPSEAEAYTSDKSDSGGGKSWWPEDSMITGAIAVAVVAVVVVAFRWSRRS